jgi:hypothetical protein
MSTFKARSVDGVWAWAVDYGNSAAIGAIRKKRAASDGEPRIESASGLDECTSLTWVDNR